MQVAFSRIQVSLEKTMSFVAEADTCVDFTIMAMALEPWRWLIGGLLVVRRQGLEFAMRAFMPWRSCENRDGLRNKDRRRKDIVQYPARPRLFLPEPDSQGDRKRTLLIQKSCCAEVADSKELLIQELLMLG